MTAKKVVVWTALKIALALFGSVFAWCWASLDSGIFFYGSPDFLCRDPAHPNHRLIYITQRIIIPSTVCHFSDGSTRQVIPWCLVVLSFLLLAAPIYFVASAIHKLNKYELWE